MTLGDLLNRFADQAEAEAAIMAIGDVALLAEVAAVRDGQGESTGEYASGAVRRFANLAADEDWLALMTAIENAGDPATACLASMLRWSMRRDRAEATAQNETVAAARNQGCSCGSACAEG